MDTALPWAMMVGMVSSSDRVARAIRCEGCGNSFEIDGLRSEVRCDHCGQSQQIDPRLLEELRAFRIEIDEHARVARQDLGTAAAWERTADQMEKGKRPGQFFLAFGLMGGLPMLMVFVGIAAMQAGVIPQENAHLVSVMAMEGAGGGVATYFVLYFTRPGRHNAQKTRVTTAIKCPECGATNRFVGDETVTTCTHCGAGLIPEEETRESVIDAAAAERRRARMVKLRAERSGYASMAGVGMGPVAMVWMIGGSFLLMVGGGSVAFTFEMLTGDEPYNPAILIMWILTFSLVGALVFVSQMIRDRRARLQFGMSQIAAGFGGTPLASVNESVAWLNAYWTQSVHHLRLLPGHHYGAAEMVVAGYHVLLDVCPKAASDQHEAFSTIRVACEIPGVEESGDALLDSPAARPIRDRLIADGFTPALSSAGILADADDALVRSLKKAGNIQDLAEPVADAARLAAALNAAPMAEIP